MWAKHHVAKKSFFVAFRYEGGGDKGDANAPKLTSETVRIRFRTPSPFYPYMEPARRASTEDPPRRLEGWIVTREPVAPVAAVAKDKGAIGWERPWKAGIQHRPSRDALARVVGADLEKLLWSDPAFVVQPFMDTKSSRAGYGDVVLVPEKPVALPHPGGGDDESARIRCSPRSNPTLAEETWTRTSVSPPPARPAPQKSGCSVAFGTAPVLSPFVALLVVLFFVARRARAPRTSRLIAPLFLLVAFVACKKATPPPPPPPAIEPPAVPFPSRAERETRARAILAGQNPNGAIAEAPEWVPWIVEPKEPGESDGKGKVTTRANLASGAMVANLDRTLEGVRLALRRCYALGLAKDAKMKGTATIDLELDPEGTVSTAKQSALTGVSEGVAACVMRALGNLAFEPAGANGAKMTVTVTFEPDT